MLIGGVVLCLFAVLAVIGGYVFAIELPDKELATTDESLKAHYRRMEQLREQVGLDGLRTIGHVHFVLAFFFLVGGLYLLMGKQGNGIGLHLGLVVMGLPALGLAGIGFFALAHPTLRAFFGNEEDRATRRKYTWVIGGIGIVLVSIGMLVR